MSKPKEPCHFGSDLDVRWRPYADRRRYLQLFERARDGQQAGEASVFYLYSKTAAREIRQLSPSARIIIMLRDPVEMVCSWHAHALLLAQEDLPDLGQALAAEADRRQGRRISSTCFLPPALQYSVLGKYSEHVRRYQEVFGRDRVKCILFEDLKQDPEGTYRETLAFLGLPPARLPDFKAHNERQQWRSQQVGRAFMAALWRGHSLCDKLPTRILKNIAFATLGIPLVLLAKVNVRKARRPDISADLRNTLRQEFREDVERLAGVLGRDLSSWLQPETKGLAATAEATKSS